MNITLDTKGHSHPGQGWQEIVVALAQSMAAVKVEAETDLTDSSTGAADAGNVIVGAPTPFVDVADVGTDLAPKAGWETALDLVVDAIAEIIDQANTMMTATGGVVVVNSSGATAPDLTIGDVTNSGVAATTGGQATEANLNRIEINNMILTAVGVVNRVMDAVGSEAARITVPVALTGSTFLDPIPAFTADVGTAADPGVTKVAADAAIDAWADDVATMAAILNTLSGAGTAIPKVNVVR